MILRIKGFDLEVKVEEGYATVLEIFDQHLFRTCLESITENILGYTNNEVVIEEDLKIVDYVKNVDLIIDYFHFEVNSKRFISSLYKKVENAISLSVDGHYKIEELLLEISNLLEDEVSEFDPPISRNCEVDVSSLLKLFEFKVDESECTKARERLNLFIDLLSSFSQNKIIVFVNLKLFFAVEEVIEIYKYLNYKHIRFICIETVSHDIIKPEIKYIIDQDFIECGPFM